MSPVIDTSDDDGRERGVTAAVDAVRAGHLVVLPTDTVYGIGADAFDEAAVAALLEAKGRGREMPPPVLVPSPRTIDGLAVDIPAYARRLVKRFWPGALTLVVRAQASLMWDLGETNGTVAVRMPDHPLTLAVLAETGPMAVTSANRTGQPPARTITDAASQLGASVTVYLDAGRSGDAEPSTIVDCTGDAPVILRHGAVPEADVLAAVADESLDHAGDEIDELDRNGTDGIEGTAVDENAGSDEAGAEAGDHDQKDQGDVTDDADTRGGGATAVGATDSQLGALPDQRD